MYQKTDPRRHQSWKSLWVWTPRLFILMDSKITGAFEVMFGMVAARIERHR
jgi:hypothetical protein